ISLWVAFQTAYISKSTSTRTQTLKRILLVSTATRNLPVQALNTRGTSKGCKRPLSLTEKKK
ncbi:hypothetical protein M9458_032110, partial [Cirrhinus mrigala]